MPESNKTNSDKSVERDKNNKESQRGLWIIIGVGVAAFLAVLVVGIFVIDAQKIRFITEFSLTTALATLVGVQAYIYKRQWDAMDSGLGETRKIVDQNERTIGATEKGAEITQRINIYSQRAYVVAKIRGIGKRDDSLQFRLRIENSGNTPANDVQVQYMFGLREQPPHRETPEGLTVYDIGFSENNRLGLVAPNSSYHVIETPETFFESPEEYRRFEIGELSYYCWGRIVYEDIFNEVRHTEFCFVQSQKRPQGYPCEQGNNAI